MSVSDYIQLGAYYFGMAIAVLLGLLMVYGVIILVLSLFWKNEIGSEMRKTCLVYFAIIAIPSLFVLFEKVVGKKTNNPPKIENVKSEFYQQRSSATNTVYVCTGPSSTKYHCFEDCLGLSRCSGDVEEMDLEEAEDEGYEPCKRCYE